MICWPDCQATRKEGEIMGRTLNRVTLLGRLGADPEVKYTQNGTAVANLSLATDNRIKRGDQWETQTEWHRVVAWGKLAEIAQEYLSKGSSLCLEGRLQTRQWEDKDGNKRYTTEIIAQNLVFLDGPAKQQESDNVPF